MRPLGGLGGGGSCEPCGQAGNPVVGVHVVGGDDLHQAGQGDHAEQTLSHLLTIAVGELAHQQRAFNAPADAVELPGQIADEGVPLAGRHRDEDDHGPGRVTAGERDCVEDAAVIQHDRRVVILFTVRDVGSTVSPMWPTVPANVSEG